MALPTSNSSMLRALRLCDAASQAAGEGDAEAGPTKGGWKLAPVPDDAGKTPLHWAAYKGNPQVVTLILDAKGEGLIGVVWAVADADRVKEAAERLGVPSFFTLDYDQDQIDANLQGRFTKYYQHFLMPSGPLGDAQVLVGEFETPD